MNLLLDERLAAGYSSAAQKIRVMSEAWTRHHILCASCGSPIEGERNNSPVLDFRCLVCREQYELKSKQNAFSRKVTDGAYKTMLARVLASNNPNFFFLAYEPRQLEVINFFVVPGHFFEPGIIEKRKPLASTARRAGWVGCNILLDQIPESGRIHYIRNKIMVPKKHVQSAWHKTAFLKKSHSPESRGWVLEVMRCIEKIGLEEFSLNDVYRFEAELKKKYPSNNFIKDKIRQQLQMLRDKGYLEFKGAGKYRVI
ncbi:MAG: DpnI domain-containing protein [Burkholderiales bacterium]